MKYTYAGAKARNKMELVGTKRLLINGRYELEDIKEHSDKLIELIEKDDYVNGERVEDVFMHGLIHFEKFKIQTTEYNDYFEEDIKTIVTKEQFKAVEYEVDKCK